MFLYTTPSCLNVRLDAEYALEARGLPVSAYVKLYGAQKVGGRGAYEPALHVLHVCEKGSAYCPWVHVRQLVTVLMELLRSHVPGHAAASLVWDMLVPYRFAAHNLHAVDFKSALYVPAPHGLQLNSMVT